jgi:hypothetical protein
MLASLVGKYVRELLMARIARFYPRDDGSASPSGYHDPVSAAFVTSTARLRQRRRVPDVCFERARDPLDLLPRPNSKRALASPTAEQPSERAQLPLWDGPAKA